MLRVMLQKVWHKKWMAACLLLGSILLLATAVSFPMYRNAAYNRMLQDEFEESLTETGNWPAGNSMTVISKKDAEGRTIARMEKFQTEIYQELGVEEKLSSHYYSLAKTAAVSQMQRDDATDIELRVGCLTGLLDHVKMLSGEMYSAKGLTEDGCVEVVVSEAALVNLNLLVGESLECPGYRTPEGDPVKIKITGVFTMADKTDFYWQVKPNDMNNVCLMEEDLFSEYFTGERAERYTISSTYYALFDYTSLQASQVEHLMKQTDYLLEESPYRSTFDQPVYRDTLTTYTKKETRIDTTLFILQIPVLILLAAFMIMISKQMYEMEGNEISVLKSRGASQGQILRLYFYQNLLLSILGSGLGLPLAAVFCKLLGCADNFLQFNLSRKMQISYGEGVLWYGLAAVIAQVVITTWPAIKHSRVGIVKLKQSRGKKQKNLWEKCFLDVIFLAVSLYGYYNYSNHGNDMAQRVLKGEPLDPLLYISSTLFILGCGLLFLRVQPLLIKFVYWIGKKRWRPASYASFLETIKNGKKQQFIMLFLILTVSLGMFHATVARTILQNASENADYLSGADLVIQEVWSNNATSLKLDASIPFQYFEPDYTKYSKMEGASSYTRVLLDDKAFVSLESNYKQPVTVMGIHTKEFGENTRMNDLLLKEPYHQYLNELAMAPEGLLLSMNCQNDLGYKIGDQVAFTNKDGDSTSGEVIGFFDYWPGYAPSVTSLNEEGEVATVPQYQIVANLATLQKSWGITPYQVWITAKDPEDTAFFYEWIRDNQVSVKYYQDKSREMKRTVEDPLLQGTNGILTMSFIVTLLLCAAGYLIYWIMSIRSREMMFGVLRASGMHRGELFHMLILEQLFSGVLSIIAAIGVGKAASNMYVPVLQNAYAAAEQVLPIKLITNVTDMIRLYGVTAAAMGICLVVLTILVFKLNVTKALKLGEE